MRKYESSSTCTKIKKYSALLIAILTLLGIVFFTMSFLVASPSPDENIDVLTPDEIDWLRGLPTIRVAPDLNYAPLEFEEEGKIKGIAIDYLNWLSEHFPIRFELVRYPDWQAQLDAIRNEEIDMLSGAAKTPARTEYMHFTETYFKAPFVLIRRNDALKIQREEQLDSLVAVVVKGYSVNEFLEVRYPNLQILNVPTIQEGLIYVVNGQADFLVSESFVAIYYITKEKLSNLVIENDFKIDYYMNLRMATSLSQSKLAGVLTKMLATIPEDFRHTTERKWLGILPDVGISREVVVRLYAALFTLIVLVVMIVLWNRSLKTRVDKKTVELRELNAELESRIEKRTFLLSETNHQLELSMVTLQYKEQELKEVNDELATSLQDLQQSQKRLVEAEKIAALGHLVSAVAHELNTPLGNCISINSFQAIQLQELNLKIEATESNELLSFCTLYEQSTTLLSSNLEKLRQIVDRFKEISVKDETYTEEYLVLSEVAQDCCYNYKMIKDYSWTIRDPNHLKIIGSRRHYESILSNLLMNSIEHGFTRLEDREAQITIDFSRQGDHLQLTFSDNGVGIADDLLDHVLEPLFSTKNSGGVGFNIILNHLSHAMPGKLQLNNHQGKGLSVEITFFSPRWINE
jgi:signal transduction histidine kinase